MFRAIIIDDERLARRELKALLEDVPGIEVAGEAGSAAEARALLSRTRADVVFLDIRLGEVNGFDLVDAIPEEAALIFVTAHDEHALRAFEANAIDYLLKPVEPARLRRAIERLSRPTDSEQHEPAPSAPTRRLEESDWLFLPAGERRFFVKLRDVTHLSADGDYVVFHAADGRVLRAASSLTTWEQRLPRSFLRIHRCTIVNLDFVSNVEPWSHYSYQITLRGVAQPVNMSRRYAARVKALLG